MPDTLTTNQGVPIYNNQDSLTAGKDGPVIFEDVQLAEKLAHFNRERIPERVVHANGAGAYGYFECIKPMGKYTCAKFLNEAGKKTNVLVRFSTVIGSKGSADTLRDPRGFAVKFYTEEGNYDLVGNNLPVFFIRDTMKFPDLVHAFKPAPDSNIPDSNRLWDFISLSPESTHMILWLFSDRGTVKSFIKMEGFGVNTFRWVNKDGQHCFVKYHWKPNAGVETITRQEATLLAGTDPDIAKRNLYDTIDKGIEVVFDLKVQIMMPDEVNCQSFNPFDVTKVWSENKFPLISVGRMILNENPKNSFAQVEQAAFCPATMVTGIEASPDKLLQGRLFSYPDAQRHRVGANYLQLPANRPIVDVANNQRDGAMQSRVHEGNVNYEPNSLNNGYPMEAERDCKPAKIEVEGYIGRDSIDNPDNFTQAGEFYSGLSAQEQDNLIDNIVYDMKDVKHDIQMRQIENFSKADKNLGARVAQGLGYHVSSQ